MKFAALLAALLSLRVATAEAQSTESDSVLARRVTMHMRDVALRDALDRLAAISGVRLSYSAENLPLDRRVSVVRDTATLREVFDALLRPFSVEPIVVAPDHIVLAVRAADASDSATGGLAVLDRVVVTGSAIGAPERPLPIALDVIRGRDIERHDQAELSSVLDGNVPGVWLWQQSPTSMMARYGSIRGASSFGLSFPKVYIDGIEVANPLLLTQITPELVERVEVIRGPQGAAMYGSDAISGVVNIVSRHDGTAADGSHMLLRSAAGWTSSVFTQNGVPVQEHVVTVRGGSNLRSGGATVGVSSTGDYIPNAYSREIRGLADGRVIGTHSTLTTNLRLYAKNTGVPANPLLAALSPERFHADSVPQQLRMYALGATWALAPTEQWTYTLTGGVDGYQLANVSNELAAIPAVADTALRNATGSALRATLRSSAVTTIRNSGAVATTLTFGAEQSWLRDRTLGQLAPPVGGGSGSPVSYVVGTTSNSGLSAQANVAVADALYLSGGVRAEHIGQTLGASRTAGLPMAGAAYVRDLGPVTMKLRSAYGKGIRAPHAALVVREGKAMLHNPDLAPEEQSGVEAGVDLLFARIFGVHLTRFDQLASGLIQTTVQVVGQTNSGGPGSRPEYAYQLQNVGEITNRGWEAQAALSLLDLSLGGALSVVDSRVQQLAKGYTGDLRPGDRMLGVPSHTLSGTAGWARGGFQLATTLSRATDWINYDRLAIAKAWINSGYDPSQFTGQKLRPYWARYTGATRWRASASYDVWHGTLLNIGGDNLLNFQRGEPDTITIVPGRTITIGIKARF